MSITKAQAKRIALAVNGSWLLMADHVSEDIYNALSEDDFEKVFEAQQKIAIKMLKDAGLDGYCDPKDILKIVLGQESEN
jgi:hypothetical protein